MLADGGDQCLELAPQEPIERAISSFQNAPNTRIAAGLAAGLEAGDVLGELLDQRQMLGKWGQTRIRRVVNLLGRRRAGRDQGGIDLVVLGLLQEEPGIGPHLRGLKHDHHKAVAAQMRDDLLLVAATRLDADPFDLALPQPGGQRRVAIRAVVDLQLAGLPSSATSSLCLPVSMPAQTMLCLLIFVDPSL